MPNLASWVRRELVFVSFARCFVRVVVRECSVHMLGKFYAEKSAMTAVPSVTSRASSAVRERIALLEMQLRAEQRRRAAAEELLAARSTTGATVAASTRHVTDDGGGGAETASSTRSMPHVLTESKLQRLSLPPPCDPVAEFLRSAQPPKGVGVSESLRSSKPVK